MHMHKMVMPPEDPLGKPDKGGGGKDNVLLNVREFSGPVFLYPGPGYVHSAYPLPF